MTLLAVDHLSIRASQNLLVTDLSFAIAPGERLGLVGSAGVAALLVGLLSLQRPWRYLRASGRAGGGAAGFALLTGITIASYSAVDRVGVRGTQPWIYAGLIWASCTIFLWSYVWAYRRWLATQAVANGNASGSALPAPDVESVAFSSRRAGLGGLITLGAYLMILVAFTLAPLTAVAPLRESAIVLASGWGAFRLREASDRADAVHRLGSAGLVLIGALLLAFD